MIRFHFRRLGRWLRALWAYLSSLNESNEIHRRTDFATVQKPVLLIYGFGATRRSVSVLEERLRKEGFGVFTLRLGGFLGTFNTRAVDLLAGEVSDRIESLYQRFPLPRMTIIGVSKGGLIGRYYICNLGGNRRVHTLITLATPHEGNPWLYLFFPILIGFFSKGIRQMLPGSSFLERLRRQPFPKDVSVISIFSPADRVCSPRYCELALRDNVKNISIEGVHHAEFVLKRRAFD